MTDFHLSQTIHIKEEIMNNSVLGNFLFAAAVAASLFTVTQAKADGTGPHIRDHRCNPYIRNPSRYCHHHQPWQPGGTQQQPNKPIRQVPNLDNIQTLQEVDSPPQQPSGPRPHKPRGNFQQFEFTSNTSSPSYGISCKQGSSIVRHQGFRHVRALDCNGPVYTYSGMKSRYSGARIQVNVNGQIVSVNYWIAKY
jgi:hypothetical protein